MPVTIKTGAAAARRGRRAEARWQAFERLSDGDGLVETAVGPMLREIEARGAGWYFRQLQEARARQAVGRGRRARGGR